MRMLAIGSDGLRLSSEPTPQLGGVHRASAEMRNEDGGAARSQQSFFEDGCYYVYVDEIASRIVERVYQGFQPVALSY